MALSSMVPRVTNEQAPRNSIASFGDTRTQTVSVLQAIEQALQRIDLALKDVVKMQVFLVADPAKENRMDFAGFMHCETLRQRCRRWGHKQTLGPSADKFAVSKAKDATEWCESV